MRDTERGRERETETQAEGEAGPMQGARCGTRSRDSRVTPWAEGRRQTAEPPRDPHSSFFCFLPWFSVGRDLFPISRPREMPGKVYGQRVSTQAPSPIRCSLPRR